MKQLFVDGHIYTSDENNPFVSAMLVEDGVILCVGTREECESAAKADRPHLVSLGGRTVIPGFVDAHMHPVMLAEYSKQIACLPPKVNSIEELAGEIARVRVEMDEDDASSADSWICGWGYDEGKYAEGRSPNRYDLDKGCSDRPVFLVRSCEHIRCVNSRALEIAGITKDTPDPPGGAIDRDETGEPTGILRESARDLVHPFMPEETEEETVSALVDLGQLLLSQGIVAVADMGNLHPGGNAGLYAKAAEQGFRQRVAMYYMWDYFKDDPSFQITNDQMDPEKRIRIAGLKLIGDGSISGKTAWLHEPYKGTADCGMPVYEDEDLESAIQFAKECGCQISVHAMGGRAIDRVVDRIAAEEDWMQGASNSSPPFLRVEHVTEPSVAAMKTAVNKGFAFISQPIFEYCEIETYKANMEPDRLQRIYPFRTMLEKGVKLAFSTDAPATSWAVPSDPFSNLKSAVTRYAYDGTDIGQEERVSIETAIRLYTKEAAEVCGFEGLGVLAPGYAADFAVLSDDIFSVDPFEIDRIQVEETFINGEQLYKK